MRRIIVAIVVLLTGFSGAQSLYLPPASDPWWKSKGGKEFVADTTKWLSVWGASTDPQSRKAFQEYCKAAKCDLTKLALTGKPKRGK